MEIRTAVAALGALAQETRLSIFRFCAAPTVVKPDYAKWMVDDLRINFAISKRGSATGIDHLGIQVESDEQLTALREQVTSAQIVAQDQANADCCYARSDKYWTTDPQGIAWETFNTLDAIPVYGDTNRNQTRACCDAAPTADDAASKTTSCCS